MTINFQDPQIWVTIAFAIFFIVFGRIIWKNLSKFLNDRIHLIDKEIKEAQSLHSEALDFLSEEKKKAQDLENRVKHILKEGKLKIDELIKKNKEKIDIETLNIEKSYTEKIRLLEQEVIQELKSKIVDEAIENSVNQLKKNLDNKGQNEILESSLRKINSKIKEY